jgi:hypothetical protein
VFTLTVHGVTQQAADKLTTSAASLALHWQALPVLVGCQWQRHCTAQFWIFAELALLAVTTMHTGDELVMQ